jgi:hypothetical protein
MEAELFFNYKVLTMRATFSEIAKEARVDEATNALFFKEKEIGLVYYRTGWSVEQYQNQGQDSSDVDKWEAREMLEFAMPIKLPSIDY